MPRPTVLRSSHQVVFTKRSFNRGEPPAPEKPKAVVQSRVRVPSDGQIREIAHRFAGSPSFRERKKRQFEQNRVSRLANFMKMYKFVAARIRSYHGRDVIEIDLYLSLKDFVQHARRTFQSVSRYDLELESRKLVDEREALIESLAASEDIVLRPMAPKDARERGADAYTEAAMKRRKDARIKDRITVRARLPGRSEDLFITLGPATWKGSGWVEPYARKILSIQSEAEWNAWRRNRIREPKVFRNDHRRREAYMAN